MSLPFPTTSPARNVPITHATTSQQQQQLDAPLIALTQRCNGDLRLVLHSFFSFLHRRTDFYCVHNPLDVQEGNRVTMGFREGDAEKLLLAAFRQFPLRRMPPASQLLPSSSSAVVNAGTSDVSEDVSRVEPALPPSTGDHSVDKEGQEESSGKKKTNDPRRMEDNKDDRGVIRYTPEGHQVPIGNGGSTKDYKWTQTLQEVTLALPLPSHPDTPRGKDLDVEIHTSRLQIRHKPLDKVLIGGELVGKIRPDECTWSIESNVMLITLEKMEKRWWNKVFQDDTETIDLSLVDKTHKISDYDQATQGMIRRILFDQRQERLGLPKSHELAKCDNDRHNTGHGILKDCHGNDIPADELPAGIEFIDKHNFPGTKGQ